MKEIFDKLREDVKIPEIVNKKAEDAFEKIYAECKDNTKEAEIKNIKPTKRHNLKKMTVVVAAAVMLCAVTTAAAVLKWSQSLSEGMQVSEDQMKNVENSGMNKFVEQSCTDNGITVTAIQSITDNYYTHIAFRVEGFEIEEGKQPDFEEFDITVDGKDDFGISAGFWDGIVSDNNGNLITTDGKPLAKDKDGRIVENYVLDDGTMEYHITLFNHNEEKGKFFGKPIHVELKNLGTVAKAEYFSGIEGNWTFDWTLAGADTTEVYEPDFMLEDTGAKVKKIEVSPISIMVEYDFPRQETEEEYMDENGKVGMVTMFGEPPFAKGVKLKDGTVIKYLYSGPGGGGYEDENSDAYSFLLASDRVIDVDEIESILFLKPVDETMKYPKLEFYDVPLLNKK